MDDPIEHWTVEIDADTSALEDQLKRVSSLGNHMGRALTSAFTNIAIKGKSVSDVLRGLAQTIAQMTLRAAFKPLESALSSVLQQFVGGSIGFARGAPMQHGLPIPFAAGGVVTTPTYFPMAGNRHGVMGERGAEAIMPLRRGADGRLGVAAQTGTPAINMNVNITTPDVESFRRSETQVAAMLARVVSHGGRNF